MIFFTSRAFCQLTWSQLTKSGSQVPVIVLRVSEFPLLTAWASHAAGRTPGPPPRPPLPPPGPCCVEAAVQSCHAAFYGRLRSEQLNSQNLTKMEISGNSELHLSQSKLALAQESCSPVPTDLGGWVAEDLAGALGLRDTLSLRTYTSLISMAPCGPQHFPHVLPAGSI